MKRWELSFASRSGKDVENSFTRIEESRGLLSVQGGSLLKVILFLLEGPCSQYQGYAHQFHTW